MHYSYKNKGEPRVSIIYSVFHEMICSLHVLANDEHHGPRLNWSKNMKDKMSSTELEKVEKFSIPTDEWLGILEYSSKELCWDKSVLETLEYMMNEELKDFYFNFFNEFYSMQIIERALVSLNIAPEIKEEHIQFFNSPKKTRKELVIFLRDYYTKYFAEEISNVEAIYVKKLNHLYESVKKENIYKYIETLHPRIETTKTKVNLHKYKLFEFYKKDLDNIMITIGSFYMPHLLCGWFAKTLSLRFPLYLTSYDKNMIPKDSLAVFKSVADATRLQIIKQLYQGPKSTQNLAEKLDLSEAAISKNLKLLYNAKVVSKSRDGNYVNYHLNVDMIDSLVFLMYQIITE